MFDKSKIPQEMTIDPIDRQFITFLSVLIQEIDYDIWKQVVLHDPGKFEEFVVWAKEMLKESGLKLEKVW